MSGETTKSLTRAAILALVEGYLGEECPSEGRPAFGADAKEAPRDFIPLTWSVRVR